MSNTALFTRPRRRVLGLSHAAACLVLSAHAAIAAPADDLRAILVDYDKWTTAADPIDAGHDGDLEAAKRWPDDRLTAVAERMRILASLHARLGAVGAGLTGEDALNRAALTFRLDLDLAGAAFDEERMPFNNDSGFFTLPSEMAEGTRLHNAEEADAYLTRIAALPDYFATEIVNMRRGLSTGFVQPRLVAQSAVAMTRLLADKKPEDETLLVPLRQLPASMPAAQREGFYNRGLDLVKSKIKPSERTVAAFFAQNYLPGSRNSLGAAALPDGKAYYSYRVRRETTTNLTPDEIYAQGVAEIARIRKEMDQVIKKSGFTGDFEAFLAFLRHDPQFYVSSPEMLLEKASRLAKRVDDQLPGYFGRLPRLTYGVRPVPPDIEEGYTSARYNPGSPQQGVAGGLMINTSHLDQRPLYELPALVAHEGVPGHHLQIALAQEQQGVPQFRRHDNITAYVEGWALYSEQLVSQMEMYGTPYEKFGQLSMEMWRACRLVMDVGIHWKNMSRDEAASCLRDNSALAERNIQTETDRYIAWPGQALGYKIGQMKISELRNRAETALGSGFDIRKFHDVILDDGPMPLVLLEERIDTWIAAQKSAFQRAP
jgi:uncharacterized protein (DUF885 family)